MRGGGGDGGQWLRGRGSGPGVLSPFAQAVAVQKGLSTKRIQGESALGRLDGGGEAVVPDSSDEAEGHSGLPVGLS